MSGIFGIYHRDQHPVDADILTGMSSCMKHRGPDGSDIWHDGHTGMGHCMLQTTPESLSEKLPYVNDETGLVITADARIDNRNDLVSYLGISSHLYEKIPDSQLILFAYRKWGKECVGHLLGDFAFAIWDKTKQQFFCARDHLGIKPFYYYLSDKAFVFASEAKGVLHVPLVPKDINEGRIADFLVIELEGIDNTSTFYQKIFRLPPAHTMEITKDKMVQNHYWSLDPEHEIRFGSDEEYVEAFREVFANAVQARLRSHTPVAAMLSGGIDSSSVMAFARESVKKTGAEPLPIYSVVAAEDKECRETYFIKSVIKQGGVEANTLSANSMGIYGNDFQAVLDQLQEPFDAMTLIIHIYLMANRNNHRVVLDGVEGDVLHSLSVSYPAHLLRAGHYQTALSETMNIWRNYYRKQLPLWKIFRYSLLPAFVNDRMRAWRRSLLAKHEYRQHLQASIIDNNFARNINLQKRLSRLDNHVDQGPVSMRRQHINNIVHPNLAVGLERYERVAALCSVEARHPLLDKRLVELSVALPWEQKVRYGRSKYQLRRACKGILPDEVVWRQGWEHLGWLMSSAWLHTKVDYMKDVISNHQALSRAYIKHGFLDQVIEKGYTVEGDIDVKRMWDMYLLTHWLQHQQML